MTYQEFEKSLLEILNDNSDITIGNDMSVNTRITVREDGQVFITEYEGFRRVETNININDIVERRKEVDYDEYYFIDSNDRALAVDLNEDQLYYCFDGKPSGYGPAFDHFSRFPVDENHTDAQCIEEKKNLYRTMLDYAKNHPQE